MMKRKPTAQSSKRIQFIEEEEKNESSSLNSPINDHQISKRSNFSPTSPIKFESQEQIQQFYKEKLEKLGADQEKEIKALSKEWDIARSQASSLDFQDFCFLEGTKIILTDCGNDSFADRPFKSEEYRNLHKCNMKYEKLFQEMIEKHRHQTTQISEQFQRELENFKYRRVNQIINNRIHDLDKAYESITKTKKKENFEKSSLARKVQPYSPKRSTKMPLRKK
ncbi:hypothetical protein TRFO_17470 [Tritrichomonas foetus]|uniref:Uncharacterized protein n=1 Tax=Tritrichomonas foetus TaxID=1144522 RepID=A0A1J4KSK6_9EUKA|nr:hypothetical protein TRFO_17470 [Tritrichomonas foetus]|eukprot:OHT12646.1 hypothetical protein TRFO_17470 [Tritrichomonas foetus]